MLWILQGNFYSANNTSPRFHSLNKACNPDTAGEYQDGAEGCRGVQRGSKFETVDQRVRTVVCNVSQ